MLAKEIQRQYMLVHDGAWPATNAASAPTSEYLDTETVVRQNYRTAWQSCRILFASFTTRYHEKYFGTDAMVKDGMTKIRNHSNAQCPTPDPTSIKTKTFDEKSRRGFTNMPQGVITFDWMLSWGGRGSAHSAVLVISDGKYSRTYREGAGAQV